MFTVTGKGIICKEPELFYTGNNNAICKAVAVNKDTYNDEETSHFTNLILFGDRAEAFADNITKGCLIEITSGILKHPTNNYEGKTYYKTEVTVLVWELIQNFNETNTGNRNTGKGNTGNRNTGKGNTGNGNTGKGNTGNGNTGKGNAGNGNTGKGNTGNGNTGKGNTGNRNTWKGNGSQRN